jgi:predicted GNAT family acetyltransferase
LKIKQYHTINKYWADIGEFLLTNPVKHNIVIGQLDATLDRNKVLTNTQLFALFEYEQPILTAFKNRPNIILYGENYTHQHLHYLSDYFKSNAIELKGCIGETKLIEEFSKIYTTNYSIDKTLIGHKLERLETIKLSEGKIKKCNEFDLEFVTEWIEKFGIECNMPHRPNRSDLQAMIQQRIHQGSMYKWVVYNRPVSICGEIISNEYLSKISLVYTPPAFRNNGYAISCVWALSKLILERGQKTVCLFTDKSNPTSNKIYSQIGYRPVFEDYEISYQ